ncbi:oleate hydratase [Paenibacillus albidus]|uniref:oleate hydratase n=1 Tax=Paenibacillus albidus TaxID=2041023 RepID=UPI001BE89DA8|nr:oleate hydratase [Paenibacillus albidus]
MESNFCYCWRSMFAFENWHSAAERSPPTMTSACFYPGCTPVKATNRCHWTRRSDRF